MDKNQILEILKTVLDPDLKRDIVSLGMVKEILAEANSVRIELSTTAPSEALQLSIKKEVLTALERAGVKGAQVDMLKAKSASPFAGKLPLPGIQHVVAVASGKGGVGKTTVSVNLACALSQMGFKVGLMDGDIYGPNVPLMLGVENERPEVNEDQKIVPLSIYGIKMISMGVLVPADQPMVWRGPMLHGAVTQFLQKVEWGNLDYLLVDLPPGTGDVQLSLVQTVPLSGAVMVTMPQEVSLMDMRKGILMFQKTNVPILGIVENMSGSVFGKGGGEHAAKQYQVPFLGFIPLEEKVREGGDAGKPIVLEKSNHQVSECFKNVAQSVAEILSVNHAASKN